MARMRAHEGIGAAIVHFFEGRWHILLLAVALGGIVEAIFRVEWAFPSCSDPWDGPASAVFGFPIPYLRRSVAMTGWELAPIAYALDLGLLAAVIYALLAWLLRRVPSRRAKSAVGALGGLGCTAVAVWLVLKSMMGVSLAVSIAHPPHDSLLEFRPVGVSIIREHTDCSPSEYWFPDQRRP